MNWTESPHLYNGEILHELTYPRTDHWLPGDSKEMYDAHCNDADKLDILIQNGYYPYKPIDYYTNEQGFRDPRDLSLEKPGEGFIAIGCSNTYGDGLFREQTYAYKLEQMLNAPVYNLGLPGRGHEAMFRILSYYIPKLQPKAVFLQKTSTYRRELFSSDNGSIVVYEPIGNWTVDPDNPDNNKDEIDMKLRMLSEHDAYFASKRALHGINSLCHTHNAELYILDAWQLMVNKRFKTQGLGLDIARDLKHPGQEFNTRLAKQFHVAYNNKTSLSDITDETLYITDNIKNKPKGAST